MEYKKTNGTFHPEGNVQDELFEIERMRDQSVYVYTIVTNTCSDFLTIFCC